MTSRVLLDPFVRSVRPRRAQAPVTVSVYGMFPRHVLFAQHPSALPVGRPVLSLLPPDYYVSANAQVAAVRRLLRRAGPGGVVDVDDVRAALARPEAVS